MKVTVIPIIDEAPGTIPKNLKKRLEEVEIQGRRETVLDHSIYPTPTMLKYDTKSV